MRTLLLLLGLLLMSCTQTMPQIPEGNDCITVEDINQNCYTCASTPACHWCPSDDDAVRGCYPRTMPLDCGADTVRISDFCNDLAVGLDR